MRVQQLKLFFRRICHVKDADVSIAVDISGSISIKSHKPLRKFLLDLNEAMYASFNQYRGALAAFDNEFRQLVQFTLNQESLREGVKKVKFGPGGTAIGSAIQGVADNIRKHGRISKTQMCLFITDGCTNVGPSVASVVDDLKRVCDRVIVVGISKSVKMKELRLIAKDSKVIWSRNYESLPHMIPTIISQLCRIVHKGEQNKYISYRNARIGYRIPILYRSSISQKLKKRESTK